MVASDVGGTKIATALVSSDGEIRGLSQEPVVAHAFAGVAPDHNRQVFEQFRRRLQTSR